MSSKPSKYQRITSFLGFSTAHPDEQQPGASLDGEFDAIKTTSDATLDRLSEIQRDDGALKNGVVTSDSLDPTLQSALGVAGALNLAGAALAAAASATAALASQGVATTQAGIATAAAAALAGALNTRRLVRAASTANVNIANPGTAIFDGVTLVAGERILLWKQSTPSQGGVYDFNGSGVAMTRSVDTDTSLEMPSGLEVYVSEGTLAGGTSFINSTPAPIVLATTALTWSWRNDKCEEGTFTPTLTFGGAAVGMAYASHGEYTKKGSRVLYDGTIQLSARGVSTGGVTIGGLPFTVSAVSGRLQAAALWCSDVALAAGAWAVALVSGTGVTIYQTGATGATTAAAITEGNITNTGQLAFSGQYGV